MTDWYRAELQIEALKKTKGPEWEEVYNKVLEFIRFDRLPDDHPHAVIH